MTYPPPARGTRAERDAVAGAATAGALRRLTGGRDPLRMARQIAAPMNAPVPSTRRNGPMEPFRLNCTSFPKESANVLF